MKTWSKLLRGIAVFAACAGIGSPQSTTTPVGPDLPYGQLLPAPPGLTQHKIGFYELVAPDPREPGVSVDRLYDSARSPLATIQASAVKGHTHYEIRSSTGLLRSA